MIISGASLFAEQPDVLCLCVCVCARWNRSTERKIEVWKFPHAQILNHKNTLTHVQCDHSQWCLDFMNIYVHTYKVHFKIWISACQHFLCPLDHLLFFVPSPVHLPHLHPLCPLLLYLPLFCSSTCPRIVHLSDPVTWEADSQHTHRPLYHPLICAARPNSPHSEPPDTMR